MRTITGLTGILARMSTECGACGGAITKGVDSITRGPGGSCHVHVRCAADSNRSHQHQQPSYSVPGGGRRDGNTAAAAHGVAPRRLEPELMKDYTGAAVVGGSAAARVAGGVGPPTSWAVPAGSWGRLMEGLAGELAKQGPDAEWRVPIREALDRSFPSATAEDSANRNILWLKWCNFVGLPYPFRYVLEALGVMDVVSARTLAELPRSCIEQMDALIDADLASAAATRASMKSPPPTQMAMRLSRAVTCMLKAKALRWDGSR